MLALGYDSLRVLSVGGYPRKASELAIAPDSVFNAFGGQQQFGLDMGRSWCLHTHNWNPYWNTAVYGAYANVHYGAAGAAAYFLQQLHGCDRMPTSVLLPVLRYKLQPELQHCTQIGAITRWTPVKNLTFSGEFVYSHLEAEYGRVQSLKRLRAPTAPAPTLLANQDTYQVLLRAQRNW